jgi:hypothetical protein
MPLSTAKELSTELFSNLTHMVPPSTDVIWIPSACSKMGGKVNDQLLALNKHLFHSLRRRFLNASDNWMTFYDEFALSNAVADLIKDGVHMPQSYYDAIMEHFVALLCNIN